MSPIFYCNIAAFSIAILYYVWREAHWDKIRRDRTLTKRVAYMLWAAADRMR